MKCPVCGSSDKALAATPAPLDVPTFTMANFRLGTHDACSVHGEIGPTVSVAQHLREVHGLTYVQWLAATPAPLDASSTSATHYLRDALEHWLRNGSSIEAADDLRTAAAEWMRDMEDDRE
jgi:hypothetical protein